jgi:hypothetical protein
MKELERFLANLVKPRTPPRGSAAIEAIEVFDATVTITGTLTTRKGTPEGRVGFAQVGYSEVGAGAGTLYDDPGQVVFIYVLGGLSPLFALDEVTPIGALGSSNPPPEE